MNDQPSNYIPWLAKARNDILTIENNVAGSRVPWDTVCFHAQQAAEKTLNAFLIFHGRAVARTQDLVVLLSACAEIDPKLGSLERDCQELNSYAVSARYPDDLFEPGEKDGNAMIAAVRRVRSEIMSRFPRQASEGDITLR
jgi:HEPN domain-containing protein